MTDFDALMNLVASDAARELRQEYSLSIGTVIDGFKITGFIGAGASGEVYAALNPDFGTECALKVLRETDEKALEQFLQEARMLVGLRHNNIVRVFRAGRGQGRAWIAMERLHALPENPSADEVRTWVLKLCSAVMALSERGIVHRDIKVENVLWDPVRCEPILADFGAATKQGCKSRSGTHGSSAPEQFDGKTPLDSSADVFALGKFAQRLLPEDVAASDPWRGILQQALAERFIRLRTAGQLAELICREFHLDRPRSKSASIAWMRWSGLAAAVLLCGGLLCSVVSWDDVPKVPSETFVKEVKWTWPEIHHLQEATSIYVNKDKDFELVLEIPKGKKLTIRDSLDFCCYDAEIVNAALNSDTSRLATLQKAIKLRNISIKVEGGGTLDIPEPTYSVAGVEPAQLLSKPQIKILK